MFSEAQIKDITRSLEQSILRSTSHKSSSDKAWDIAFKVLVPVVFAVVGWAVVTNESIAANTSDITSNKEAILRHTEALRQQPPDWLKEIVQDIKIQNSDILQRLAALEAQVKAKH